MNEPTRLSPLPYHREVRDYLKSQERELWRWFASARAKEDHVETLRLQLLKATYRLGPTDHADLYSHVSAALRGLQLDVPVTLYQLQASANAEPNAQLFQLPQEAHIVLSGPLTTLLDSIELTAIFGHELAHFHLWQIEEGDFLIADRILDAIAAEPGAHTVHRETARRYRLHTEIFADRGAYQVTQNLLAAVSALVKTQTGLASVNGASYLAQSAEIFSKSTVKTHGLSHPEAFIRAHALDLWTRQGVHADVAIEAMIAGQPSLDELDLAGQHRIATLSRRFLAQLLRPRWFRSDAVLAQARLFFPDFAPAEVDDATLIDEVRTTGPLVGAYFAYLLLDFSQVDPDLEDLPIATAVQWADRLGIASDFEKMLSKEIGFKPKALAQLKPRVTELLASAEKTA
jgi:hypothetical protein